MLVNARWLCVGVIVTYSIGYYWMLSGYSRMEPAAGNLTQLRKFGGSLPTPETLLEPVRGPADLMPALTILAIVSPDVPQQVEQWRGWMASMQQRDPGTIYRVKVLYTEQSTPLHKGFGTAHYKSLIKLRSAALATYVRNQVGHNQDPIIFTDLDVVPLQPYSALLPSLDHHDLSFSKEFYGSGSGFVNWGFSIFRPKPEVALLFEDVNINIRDQLWSDQLVGNRLLWGWQSDTVKSPIPASTLTNVSNIREGLKWSHLGELVVGQDLACIRHNTVAFHANGHGAGGKIRKITIAEQIVMKWHASDCYENARIVSGIRLFNDTTSPVLTLFVCQDICSAVDACIGIMYNKYRECYLQTNRSAIVPDSPIHNTVTCLKRSTLPALSKLLAS